MVSMRTHQTRRLGGGAMIRRLVATAVLITFASAVAVFFPMLVPGVPTPPASAPPPQPIRIMPLGDSITGSTGCWRDKLWDRITEAKPHQEYDFVGHRHGKPKCDGDYDNDSNGISGVRVSELAASGDLTGWLAEDPADIVLMHYGSNDIRHGWTTSEIIDALGTVVEQMRQANPRMVILVAQIIPMTTTPMDKDCADCPGKVDALNAEIPGWASGVTTAQSPVVVVDQFSGFDAATDTYDGLHSDGSGGKKIAEAWYQAMKPYL